MTKVERWWWLVPKDQYYNNFLFWKDGKPRTLRPAYAAVRCQVCGKLDELKALQMPLQDDIKIRARGDVVLTHDGFLLFSQHLQDVLSDNRVQGVRYLAIPNEDRYRVAIPTCYLPVDPDTAGFQYAGAKCVACGRYRHGVYVGPLKPSYSPPEDNTVMCAPEVFQESGVGRVFWFLVSDLVKSLFKKNGIRGVEFGKPL